MTILRGYPRLLTMLAVAIALIELILYLPLESGDAAGAANVAAAEETAVAPAQTRDYLYIEVADSCGAYYEGACVVMRSGPGDEYKSVARLRDGMVLKVDDIVTVDERQWYKLAHDTDIRYPERVSGDWYVAADLVHVAIRDGDHVREAGTIASSSKRIIVDRSQQMLYAYDGDALFMQQSISTGLELTPTPRGTFTVYKKTPSRYMQGPLPGVSDQYYDLPGVPWNLYFTPQGGVIHGAYWHDHFGRPWSHGCVNLPVAAAKILYDWADIGTSVVVQN